MLLSACLVCTLLGFSCISYASEPDLKTWLEEGESWLCEEHYVLDIPDREDDFCWECYLANRPVLYGEDTGTNPIILDSYTPRFFYSSSSRMNMTAINTGWTTSRTPYHFSSSYYALDIVGPPTGGFLEAGSSWIHLKVVMTRDDGTYLGVSDLTYLALSYPAAISGTEFVHIAPSWCSGPDSEGYCDLWVPFSITDTYSAFLLKIGTSETVANITVKFGMEFWHDVSLSELPDGSVPGGGEVDPPVDETIGKTWLGGLIESIIQGINTVIDGIVNLPSSIATALSGALNAIKNAVTSIGTAITNAIEVAVTTVLDGLKTLFIPSEGYFSGLFERLNTFFSERFGLLYFPIEHMLSVLNRILTLTDQAPQIVIPELKYEGETFIPAMVYTFDFLEDEPWASIHGWYLVAMDVALIMCVVKLLQTKYEEVFKP